MIRAGISYAEYWSYLTPDERARALQVVKHCSRSERREKRVDAADALIVVATVLQFVMPKAQATLERALDAAAAENASGEEVDPVLANDLRITLRLFDRGAA